MTPWWAWAIVLAGPVVCAGAGAVVALAWTRGRRERALDAAWEEGYDQARYDMAVRYDTLAPRAVPAVHHDEYRPQHAALIPSGDALVADLQVLAIRAEFVNIRYRLGLTGQPAPDYAELVAAEGLIVNAAPVPG